MVKNPNTKAARAVRQLRAGQKIALTGTPVENRLERAVGHSRRGQPGDPRRARTVPQGLRVADRARLRPRSMRPTRPPGSGRITGPFILRRTKADKRLLPDLPDKIEQVAYAKLTKEQAALYQTGGRPAPGRRRAGQGHAPAWTRARGAHAAQADLQPPRTRAQGRLAARRPVGQADSIR